MSSSPKSTRRRKPSSADTPSVKRPSAPKKNAKKASAKKSAAKKPARKSAAKKPAAKKPGPRKSAAKKLATKKSPAKKPAAKAPKLRTRVAPAIPKNRRRQADWISYPTPGNEDYAFPRELPLLPLRDVVIFPGMMVPLLVGRPASVAAVERAANETKSFAVLAQIDPQESEPVPEDLHHVGTVVRIVQILKIPDGTLKVLAEGVCRIVAEDILSTSDHLSIRAALAEPPQPSGSQIKALTRRVVEGFQEYVRLNRRVPDEIVAALGTADDPQAVAHVVSGHLLINLPERQDLLATLDLKAQLERISEILGEELEVLQLEEKIEGEVRNRVTKGQKEFYLQEQIKAIRKELGEGGEDEDGEGLRESVKKAGMPEDVEKKAIAEVDRLQRMGPMSPEATVVRGYVETLASLPWKKRTRDRIDLKKAAKILDEDHYGLDKIKERILEYLAVVKLVKRPKGSILCLVGPPGVGKTSLGRSVGRALGRKFVRVSLGGVRDEAEIRGHRRTYIGSMPGRIIQGIRKAGTKNPVFLLDEVDKLSSDFRGDPSSALLEVLDPEQNKTFNDHYLDVDFDLSEVMFITTANVLPAIPPPLRDRMEILRLPGYLEHEKSGIARKFLLPKQLKEHGLKKGDVSLTAPALKALITRYTREAGVRNLEREIANLCRKVAREKVGGRGKAARIGLKTLEKHLGPPRFPERRIAEENQVGLSYGLAWTEYGGDVLPVEVMVLAGSGKISLTGRLGEVMRESAKTALSYARSRAGALGLAPDFADRLDLHLHMPEGAIPKDGPSAGVSITTAVISALTRIPIQRDVCMTGEITLLGKVLAIGGLNEKVVAASLAGYRQVVVPKANQPDWEEIADVAKKGLKVTFVEHVDEVLRAALVPSPAVERLLGKPGHPPEPEGLPGVAH